VLNFSQHTQEGHSMRPLCGWKSGLLLGLGAALIVSLSGCGPKRLRADFRGFEVAYADTSNQETLLNLARLQRRDPTYFFKLGQVTSSYRMQASLTANGALTPQGMTPGGSLPTGGGSPGLIFENDPVFQFIPVNDDTNSQLLLKPIPAETFYILYQQGWRVDQLFRLMVDRIELTRSTGKGCEVEIIRNQPPPSYPGSNGSYDKEGPELVNYVTFLRVSAIVYALQKHGLLLLRGENSFLPIDNNAVIPADSKSAPAAKDMNDAIAKDTAWETDEKGNWRLGHKVFSPVFTLNPQVLDTAGTGANGNRRFRPDMDKIQAVIHDDLSGLSQGPALRTALEVLASGFSIEGTADPQTAGDGPCPSAATTSHLVMRSMLGMMAAAAQEQASFDALEQHDPTIPFDDRIPQAMQEAVRPDFKSAVPPSEQIPLLRISWDGEHQPDEPLVNIHYRGNSYLIADDKSTAAPENTYWNRDMFRLIGQLTSQVTVDISKFPLPEILQLHTQ
jgi:hypothetical protein